MKINNPNGTPSYSDRTNEHIRDPRKEQQENDVNILKNKDRNEDENRDKNIDRNRNFRASDVEE